MAKDPEWRRELVVNEGGDETRVDDPTLDPALRRSGDRMGGPGAAATGNLVNRRAARDLLNSFKSALSIGLGFHAQRKASPVPDRGRVP
jgi:hypothetical protein